MVAIMSNLFNQLKNAAQGALNQNSNNQGLSSLLGPAVVGGLMGALFGGSKSVRKVAKNAAYIGGGAIAASMAYKMYQNWQANKNNSSDGNTINTNANANSSNADAKNLFDSFNNQNASQALANDDKLVKILITAMVFAARADGHIDQEEQSFIFKTTQDFNNDKLNELIKDCLNRPLDVNYLAQMIENEQEAKDVYALSLSTIVCDSESERQYLADLKRSLKLKDEDVAYLQNQSSN